MYAQDDTSEILLVDQPGNNKHKDIIGCCFSGQVYLRAVSLRMDDGISGQTHVQVLCLPGIAGKILELTCGKEPSCKMSVCIKFRAQLFKSNDVVS